MAIKKGTVWAGHFNGWLETIRPLLDKSGLIDHIGRQRILLKPNLVEALEPPITTPVELVAALVDYLREKLPDPEIIIGEGTGATGYDTFHPFQELGYSAMAGEKGIELLDLNREPLREMSDPACKRWPQMALPEILFDSFLLSVPVLKAHSLAGVTLTMKNMMGADPPSHFRQGGWNKAAFHTDVQAAVFDLNRYRTPDFTVLDATVGMAEAHLWGPVCSPPPAIIAAGFDPVAIDAYGAGILGRNWRDIGHLQMAHNILGRAEPLTVDI